MKIRNLILSSLLLCPLSLAAEGVKTVFVSAVFNASARQPIEMALPQTTANERGPVIHFDTRRVSMGTRTIALSAIKSFSFDIRVVDGIAEMSTSPQSASTGYTVYTVNGQLVRRRAVSLEGLPKGVYIVNGKKHIVK